MASGDLRVISSDPLGTESFSVRIPLAFRNIPEDSYALSFSCGSSVDDFQRGSFVLAFLVSGLQPEVPARLPVEFQLAVGFLVFLVIPEPDGTGDDIGERVALECLVVVDDGLADSQVQLVDQGREGHVSGMAESLVGVIPHVHAEAETEAGPGIPESLDVGRFVEAFEDRRRVGGPYRVVQAGHDLAGDGFPSREDGGEGIHVGEGDVHGAGFLEFFPVAELVVQERAHVGFKVASLLQGPDQKVVIAAHVGGGVVGCHDVAGGFSPFGQGFHLVHHAHVEINHVQTASAHAGGIADLGGGDEGMPRLGGVVEVLDGIRWFRFGIPAGSMPDQDQHVAMVGVFGFGPADIIGQGGIVGRNELSLEHGVLDQSSLPGVKTVGPFPFRLMLPGGGRPVQNGHGGLFLPASGGGVGTGRRRLVDVGLFEIIPFPAFHVEHQAPGFLVPALRRARCVSACVQEQKRQQEAVKEYSFHVHVI